MNWMEKIRTKLGSGQRPVGQTDGGHSERVSTGTVLRKVADPAVVGDVPPAIRTVADWVLGQQLLDDYVVEGVLGEGGMGKVYLLRSRSTSSCFAVKRAKGLGEVDRRNFLAELQTWIDLPEHTNLVSCRFFRTVGDEILIFAEYVEGGSLEEWIHSGKLYEGGKEKALERMLGVAIQFAWGLHCLHELGLVHQDVKPGNMLMSGDGKTALQGVKPRVTDYGLARARAMAGGNAPSSNVLVSGGGGTPAYWSPEQAAEQPLTAKTDIWSWGVSVLEMFAGEVSWMSGLGAAEILEQHRRGGGTRGGGTDGTIPAMPEKLAELLKECFRDEPKERLGSLDEAVARLKTIYQESVGTDYDGPLQVVRRGEALQTGIEERRISMGAKWADPRQWLEKALRAAGRDPSEAASIVAGRGATRQGELVGEIAVYDEAKRLYVRLVQEGRTELEDDLAALCAAKALVHTAAADTDGAIGEYDQAIAIRERMVKHDGRWELANILAAGYVNKAIVLSDLGDKRGAVELHDKATAIWERLVNQEGHPELADNLALSYMNKAIALSDLGDSRTAIGIYDKAIAIQERLVNREGRRELANDLAMTYLNKATAEYRLGDIRGAVRFYEQAIGIWERLVNQEGQRNLANLLAMAYTNKAAAVRALGDHRAAVTLNDQAIAIRERLVNQEGQRELEKDLADAYLNKALAVGALGDYRAAVTVLDQVIAIGERLVYKEGRRELAKELANAYLNKGSMLQVLDDNRAALTFYDRAIAIRERLVNQEGRRALANDLAMAYANKGLVLGALGDNRAAVVLCDQAIAIRERLVEEGRRELANDLASAYMNKAEALWKLGDNGTAARLYDQAIVIRERLVQQEGRRELANDLAMAYVNKGIVAAALGDNRAAVALYDQAIVIREQLVNQEGHRELANDLAMAYTKKGLAVDALGQNQAAVALYDQAIAIWERSVNEEGRRELAKELATVYLNKAIAAAPLGDIRGTVSAYERAIAIWERLVNQEGRREFVVLLGGTQSCFGEILIALREKDRGLQYMRSAEKLLEDECNRAGDPAAKQHLAWARERLRKHAGSA